LEIAKLGGRIVLSHASNEAERENCSGMHQWNFDSEGNDFIIWNKEDRFNITEMFTPYADIHIDASQWVTVIMTKKAELSVDLASRSRDRIRELLPAMTKAFYNHTRKSNIGRTVRDKAFAVLRAIRCSALTR
jgi:hypothetical protein